MITRLPLNSMRRRSGASCCPASGGWPKARSLLRRILRGGRHEVAFQRAGHHCGGKQPARYGVGPCSPGGRRENAFRLPFVRRLARCGEAGLSCLPLDEPESLPERCRGLLGEPPAHLVDLMHSRFESLIAGAAPEAIMEWAAVDIGLRARLVRAVGRSMLARGSGVACSFHPAPPSARLKDRGIMRPPSWLARLCTGALPWSCPEGESPPVPCA